MESVSSSNLEERSGIGIVVRNPFAFKVGQVFTGFGIGCGVGIGIGRPLNLGAIPALQQVTSAARGATDVFSGFGRHVNSSLRRFGAKNIEVGIGCGVGFGHGFGVGLAIKPGVLYHLQSCVGEALMKMMMKFGVVPSISNSQNVLPSSLKSSMNFMNDTTMQSSIGNVMQMASKSLDNTSQGQHVDFGMGMETIHEPFSPRRAPSKTSVHGSSEQVRDNILQNQLLKEEEDFELRKLVLKHQKIIDELMDENKRLREVLIEDLKVSPNKLQASNMSSAKSVYSPCFHCLECRRRQRKHR